MPSMVGAGGTRGLAARRSKWRSRRDLRMWLVRHSGCQCHGAPSSIRLPRRCTPTRGVPHPPVIGPVILQREITHPSLHLGTEEGTWAGDRPTYGIWAGSRRMPPGTLGVAYIDAPALDIWVAWRVDRRAGDSICVGVRRMLAGIWPVMGIRAAVGGGPGMSFHHCPLQLHDGQGVHYQGRHRVHPVAAAAREPAAHHVRAP
ncbi:unnamed protein product [Urochloa humidicola]